MSTVSQCSITETCQGRPQAECRAQWGEEAGRDRASSSAVSTPGHLPTRSTYTTSTTRVCYATNILGHFSEPLHVLVRNACRRHVMCMACGSAKAAQDLERCCASWQAERLVYRVCERSPMSALCLPGCLRLGPEDPIGQPVAVSVAEHDHLHS